MPPGVTRGIWHGIYSRLDQYILVHVMLESGAHWSGLPLESISTTREFVFENKQLMPWASMGENIDVAHFTYLEGLSATTISPIQADGRHTGIMIDWKDGYSRYPQEHKPLNLINLEQGQFALLPNNFTLYTDKHFTEDNQKQNLKHYLRGETVYWGE